MWAKMTLETPQLRHESARRPADAAAGAEDTRAKILAFFDKDVPEARAAIAAASDEAMMQPWALLNGGKPIFTMPRVAVLRGMIMNHIIHHRAQLGVYLRLNDVPVPAIYGPSADETGHVVDFQGGRHDARRPPRSLHHGRSHTARTLRQEFNRWAEAGRGEGMEQDHLPIVLPVLDRMRLAPTTMFSTSAAARAGWPG